VGAARSPGAGTCSRAAHGARGDGVAGAGLRISRELRAVEDGYSSSLVPGVRASADAERLAHELAFSSGRLLALERGSSDAQLPDFYADVRALAVSDVEQATWACFLLAYLCPLEDEDPFAGIRDALGVAREQLANIVGELPRGPRSSYDAARGTQTLDAYRAWYAQAGRATVGGRSAAFGGDESWTPERRFERVFERLALPGFTRAARYELLVLLGAVGVYELRAGSLQLGRRAAAGDDATTLAAKRVFAIGDPLLLERRAAALAQAVPVQLAALELALWNWGANERATLGFAPAVADEDTLALARGALGL
jgi:hypothetical protein